MQVDSIEILGQCDPNDPSGTSAWAGPERRRRTRTPLRCPITLFRCNSTDAVESTTSNLSCEGFHCLVESEYLIGDQLTALLRIPAFDPSGKEQSCTLSCLVRVIRVDACNREGIYGLSCAIDAYHLTHTQQMQTPLRVK
jgi:PilZ domain